MTVRSMRSMQAAWGISPTGGGLTLWRRMPTGPPGAPPDPSPAPCPMAAACCFSASAVWRRCIPPPPAPIRSSPPPWTAWLRAAAAACRSWTGCCIICPAPVSWPMTGVCPSACPGICPAASVTAPWRAAGRAGIICPAGPIGETMCWSMTPAGVCGTGRMTRCLPRPAPVPGICILPIPTARCGPPGAAPACCQR